MEGDIIHSLKLGDTLEKLNNSIKTNDYESAFKAFKLLKENKYSLFIEQKKDLDKTLYNEISLSSKKI